MPVSRAKSACIPAITPAPFVAQPPGLVQFRVVAGRDKAAVARQQRRLCDQGGIKQRNQRLVPDQRCPLHLPAAAARPTRQLRWAIRPACCKPLRIAAMSRGPPRSSASRERARSRSGSAAGLRASLHESGSAQAETAPPRGAHRITAQIARRCRNAALQQPSASARSPCGRWSPEASLRARPKGLRQLQIAPRSGVNLHDACRPTSRCGACSSGNFAALRQIEIVGQAPPSRRVLRAKKRRMPLACRHQTARKAAFRRPDCQSLRVPKP